MTLYKLGRAHPADVVRHRVVATFAIAGAAVSLLNGWALAQNQQAADPNFPGVLSPPGLNVEWTQYSAGGPIALIKDPSAHEEKAATYLGWNEQGSWLVGSGTGKIYIWNLSKNSVIKAYDNYKQIPPDILATLKNNPYAAAKNPTVQPPAHSEGPHPQTPDTSRQAALFGGSGKLPDAAATTPGAIMGSAAAVDGDVLTFTRPDKSKATYKVVRPKVMQSAPQASGIAGTWIAMEASGSGILFTVQADNSVTGREMPAQLIQMLVQGAPQR
jgi:hypothetical protein